jgi:peptidoglycan DL-endopeptidase CwlO
VAKLRNRVLPVLLAGVATAMLLTGCKDGSNGGGHPVTRNYAERLANRMARDYGWRGHQRRCLDWLWTRESGFSTDAVNSQSGATGIPQLLPAAHRIPAHWGRARVQVRWGLSYVSRRYGTPCNAWHHEEAFGWY